MEKTRKKRRVNISTTVPSYIYDLGTVPKGALGFEFRLQNVSQPLAKPWTLSIHDITILAPVKMVSLVLLGVELLIRHVKLGIQCIAQSADHAIRMQSVPGIDARIALARLGRHQQGVESHDHLVQGSVDGMLPIFADGNLVPGRVVGFCDRRVYAEDLVGVRVYVIYLVGVALLRMYGLALLRDRSRASTGERG